MNRTPNPPRQPSRRPPAGSVGAAPRRSPGPAGAPPRRMPPGAAAPARNPNPARRPGIAPVPKPAPKKKAPQKKAQAAKPPSKIRKARNKLKMFSVRAGIDLPFFLLVLTLVVIGLIMLFSASYASAYYSTGSSYTYILRQGMFALVGVAVMVVVSFMDYHVLHKLTFPLLIASWGMLGIVLLMPPIAYVHRWFQIGSFSFQPSEIAKFALVLWFAHYISLNFKKMDTIKVGILPHLVVVGITCGLVVVEPHFSATIILLLLSGVMLFVGGVKNRWFLIVFAAIAIAGIVYFAVSDGYANVRIQGWFNPFDNSSNDRWQETWQTRNSLYAIGSGGWMGSGLGQSRQKYMWLPEPQNDFIYAIICEELGFVGAFIIMLLFILLVWRGVVISLRAKDKFGMLLGVGLSLQVGLQAVLNIGVVTNTIPNTGISLPFFSYGGTSLVILLAQMGVVLSISRTSNIEKT